MFDFNPKSLSDEELLEKVMELTRRMVWAHRMGHSGVTGQLQMIKALCEQEQRERLMSSRSMKILAASPVIVETDPDLAAEARKEQDAKNERDAAPKGPRAKPFVITRERMKPSSRPTNDS